MRIGNLYIGKESERLKELETSVEKLKHKLERAEVERDALKDERDEARAVAKLKLQVEADELALLAKERYLDKREEYLGKLAQAMKWDKAHPTLTEVPGALPEEPYYYPYY